MMTAYLARNNLEKEYRKTSFMLKKIKTSKFSIIAVDYDGTIFDRYDPVYNNLEKALQLAYETTKKGIEFAFISGRNTTLEMELRETAPLFCKKKKTNLTIWRSGGNGMNLYKITYTPRTKDIKIETIYSNNISIEAVKKAIGIYKDLNIQPDPKSKAFFKSFLVKELPKDLVPKSFLRQSLPFDGKVFAESVKVTFVLPTDPKEQAKYIDLFRKKLSINKLTQDLNVGWGKIPFADISKRLKLNGRPIDGKLLMVKNIIKKLGINKFQVVTFGDASNDNNKNLLSLPYSFTNDKNVIKTNINSPPFVLKVTNSPVESVYKAIKYLIY